MTKMWKEILEQPEVIERCAQSNAPVIERLVEEIRRRDIACVVIAGRGTSDHAAVYGKYMIEILTGLPVSLAAPSVCSVYGGALNLRRALVIGLSQSGRAADVAAVLETAETCGAITVGITNSPGSPLAALARYHLYCDAGLEESVAATKTFTAQMFLIGSLAIALSGDAAQKEDFRRIPGLIRSTFETVGELPQVVERYRFISECLVLARGVIYPVALEAALKIQETSYVRAKAFATSDFYHGPMAILEKELPVIILAPVDAARPDVLALAGKIRDAGGDILMIADEREICGLGDRFVTIPKAGRFTSPFCCAVAAQMFACRLSLLRGLDPDAPRMLHKVTVTL